MTGRAYRYTVSYLMQFRVSLVEALDAARCLDGVRPVDECKTHKNVSIFLYAVDFVVPTNRERAAALNDEPV